MAELHQVLAVERDLEQEANKIVRETINTFTKKTELFTGHIKTLEMHDDDRQAEAEALKEIKEVTTTVPERLKYTSNFFTRHLDCLAQKEKTNQIANDDIVVDGKIIISSVPATLLLALERKLGQLRNVYASIPTLTPGVKWEPDTDAGKNIYKMAEPRKSHRTEKTLKVVSLAKATKEHKEQVQVVNIDRPVGTWTMQQWSGLISPAQKAKILGRLDDLVRAVKEARSRANKADVQALAVGEAIFNFIHGELS